MNRFTEQVLHRTESRPFSIHHTVPGSQCAVALYVHCHEEMEIFYLDKGILEFHIAEQQFLLEAGNAVFIPSGLIHYALREKDNHTDCSFYAVVFTESMITETLPSYCGNCFPDALTGTTAGIHVFRRGCETDRNALNCIRDVLAQMNVPVAKCELLVRGSLLVIWHYIYVQFTAAGIPVSGKKYPGLDACISYIAGHYGEDIRLSDLSRAAGKSEGYLCRMFRMHTGFTPFEYLTKVRITNACKLLQATDKKIAAVATLCGFNNISYFNRSFLQVMHETPSCYRRYFLLHTDILCTVSGPGK